MQPKNSKITISERVFKSAIEQIQNANSFDNLFTGKFDAFGITHVSYHHFSNTKPHHPQDRKRYFSYNLPKNLINFFENQYQLHEDAGVKTVFSSGRFAWLSDMVDHPLVIKQGNQKSIKTFLKTNGDGLLIPLYGPQNRLGYLYISFGKGKEAFDPLFGWQAQSLAQIAHVKYTLMLLSIKTEIKLTKRETEVLELMALGKTNPEIGIILNISANTVSGYVKQIFLKLGTADRVSTALLARSLNLLN